MIGGGVGVGLVVAFLVWPRRVLIPPSREGESALNGFVRIGGEGDVTVAVPQTEVGQGVWTALPQILADELGAAWESVAVEPAPLADLYANPLAKEVLGAGRAIRITAGSTSVRGFEQPLREAGAVARQMLCAVAAERWGVSPGACDTADGFVRYDGKALAFGELAEEAATLDPPSQPELRPKAGVLFGKPLPRLDLPPKSDGSFRFAGDVRLPEMLFASARRAPPNGRLTAFSRAAAEQIAGVRQVVVRDDWLAVVADTSWIAERGLRAASPHFEGLEGLSREGLRAVLDEALEAGDAETWFRRGDYPSAVKGSRPLAATYWIAPAQHLGLEPLSATARISRGRLEVWAATQAPEFAREAAARAADLDLADVTLYPMPAGDGGGRTLEADLVPVAVELAKVARRPVQVSMPQHSSQNHDRVAPPALAKVMALPGPEGIPTAWKMRVATMDGLGFSFARLERGSVPDDLGPMALDGAAPPYSVPNVQIDGVARRLPIQAGYLRGNPQRTTVFAVESFVDELARATGQDPLAFRMTMLGQNPRLARCISTAAGLGGWDGGGPGSTLGLAAASLFGSHIGLLADASIGADRRIEVHRLVAVIDCGRIANPQLVRQQIESGLIWALGLATVREPEWAAGMPRSRPLGGLGVPRMKGTPRIEIHLVPSNAAPGGVSGLGVAVLAPAVANAIAAGSGRRLRDLPFDLAAA